MKSLIVVFIGLLSFSANAFEVICSCEEPCKQVVFEVSESEAGDSIAIDTETSLIEGVPTVISSKVKEQVVYKLGHIALIREGNNFRMLGSKRVCGLLVEPR